MIEKIYGAILVDRVRKVTEGLSEDVQGGFRAGRGFVDQIFTLNQIREKAREKYVECTWVLWTWRKHMIMPIGKYYGKY